MTAKISLPKLPKQLDAIALHPDTIQDDAELVGFTSSGTNLMHVAAENVHLAQGCLQNVNLSYSRLWRLRLADIQITGCDLANGDWMQTTGQRIQLRDCRLVGFAANEAYLQDVHIEQSLCTSSQFRFSRLKRAIFDECDLRNANFQGSDLTGVRFHKCNLDGVQFSGAKLHGADLRGCSIMDVKIGVNELAGAVVEHFQAAYLASLMGVVIKGEDEP